MKYNVSLTMQHTFESFKKLDFAEWIKLWPTQFLLTVLEIDLTKCLCEVFDYEIKQKNLRFKRGNRVRNAEELAFKRGNRLRNAEEVSPEKLSQEKDKKIDSAQLLKNK